MDSTKISHPSKDVVAESGCYEAPTAAIVVHQLVSFVDFNQCRAAKMAFVVEVEVDLATAENTGDWSAKILVHAMPTNNMTAW